jgi:hypothetical protein
MARPARRSRKPSPRSREQARPRRRLAGVIKEGHAGSLKTYGRADLVVAALLIVCAFLVVSGSQVGRWVGIAAGAIGCIGAIWWMPYDPMWSLTYVAFGALVICALAAYRGKAEAALLCGRHGLQRS